MLKECFEHIERRNMPSLDELIARAKIIEVYCCHGVKFREIQLISLCKSGSGH